MMQALVQMLRKKEQPQLDGMAGGAQKAMSGREYQLYVQEQKAQGLPAVSAQEFAAGQR
jgi:hypothetical protein